VYPSLTVETGQERPEEKRLNRYLKKQNILITRDYDAKCTILSHEKKVFNLQNVQIYINIEKVISVDNCIFPRFF
jgi:hypothetical protein